MKIEKAIQQQAPFRSPQHRVAVNLIYTYNWLTDQIRLVLKPHGITLQQYNVLRVLRGAGEPISTSVIRQRLLDKMADTSRLVERLAQKGLVYRKPCKHDKRLVDISLTDAGHRILKEIDHLDERLDAMLNNLTDEDATLLSDLLDKLREGKELAEGGCFGGPHNT